MLYLAQTAAPAANANLFVIYLAEFWPAAKEPWPRFVILTLLVGLLALINARGAQQGTAVSNLFTVAKILPLLMVVSAGAAGLNIPPPARGGGGGGAAPRGGEGGGPPVFFPRGGLVSPAPRRGA